jgi:uncharacterized hydrophobic protein (TIGR00271 family)
MNRALLKIYAFLKDRFSLSSDRANEQEIIEAIRKGVEFKGVNVWVLIFAIMIASVGLNVNATAVIIGAMLISPLMGPIMGIGLGLGISDTELIKKAARNLAVMVVVSVVTSTLYFLLSPLQQAQSELLNRTTPTTWDVFIALFGGLAGIIATASKERGNVIPGVAIATALMPPLCTAGYGIATGSLNYFAGAFYLFTINAVFICFSTLLIVRFLRFHEVNFVSQALKKKVRSVIGVSVVLMVLPSIYIARNLVLKTVFEEKVNKFVGSAFQFPSTEVVKFKAVHKPEQSIEVALMGSPLDPNTIANLQNMLVVYDLKDVKLVIRQGERAIGAEEIKSKVLEEFVGRNLDSLKSKDERIAFLTKELYRLKQQDLPMQQISREAVKFDANVKEICIQQSIFFNTKGNPTDTIHIALTKFNKIPPQKDIQRLSAWLKERIASDSVRVVVN